MFLPDQRMHQYANNCLSFGRQLCQHIIAFVHRKTHSSQDIMSHTSVILCGQAHESIIPTEHFTILEAQSS